ncbi:hypothetical protein [Brevundimonas sp. PWP3-1b1]|uniref:hypothetical protein n=1 Tax=unclassified Brevundimonas TaxID=2622653 RepID=UPI003CF4A4D2
MRQIRYLIAACVYAATLALATSVPQQAWAALFRVIRDWLSSDGASDWVSAFFTMLAVFTALGIAVSESVRARKAEKRARTTLELDTLKAARVCIARLTATVGALDQTCQSGELEGFVLTMYRDNIALGVAQLNALPLHHLPTHGLISPVTNIALTGGTVVTMLDVIERYREGSSGPPSRAFEDIRRRIESTENDLGRAVMDAKIVW